MLAAHKPSIIAYIFQEFNNNRLIGFFQQTDITLLKTNAMKKNNSSNSEEKRNMPPGKEEDF